MQVLAISQVSHSMRNTGARIGPNADGGGAASLAEGAGAGVWDRVMPVNSPVAARMGSEGDLTLWGCWMYLIARIVYIPLYAAGIPYVRSLVWLVSLAGLVMVLAAVLTG